MPTTQCTFYIIEVILPVQRDCAEVEDRRRATEHVRREPDLAEGGAKDPAADDDVEHVERENEDGDGQVRGREGHDEEVGGDLQGDVGEHADDDEDVAHDCHDNDRAARRRRRRIKEEMKR